MGARRICCDGARGPLSESVSAGRARVKGFNRLGLVCVEIPTFDNWRSLSVLAHRVLSRTQVLWSVTRGECCVRLSHCATFRGGTQDGSLGVCAGVLGGVRGLSLLVYQADSLRCSPWRSRCVLGKLRVLVWGIRMVCLLAEGAGDGMCSRNIAVARVMHSRGVAACGRSGWRDEFSEYCGCLVGAFAW